MESIEELVKNLNPEEWEKQVYGYVCEQSQRLAVALLRKMDDDLLARRAEGLTVVGFRERWVITLFGQVRIKRRFYRDEQGRGRFLLDETMGLDKRSPLSSGVKELCALLSGYMPFGKGETLLNLLLPVGVSHTTIHRQVGKIADPALAKEEQEVAEVFEQGNLPEVWGKRQVPILFVESDGVSVALQREKERRAEVKAGIACEGWEAIGGQGRFRLTDKTAYPGLMGGERFWEGFSLVLSKKYDLSSIRHVVVGGDGAHWVRDGAGFMNGSYQLDRFHLRRELLRALRGDVETANQVYQACVSGNVALADSLLLAVQQKSRWNRDDAIEIARVRAYILDNTSGLRDYRLRLDDGEVRGLRGLGAIEGNVDKLVANRMKKRGMSWTKKGAQRMARLLQMQQWGEICTWTTKPTKPAPLTSLRSGTRARIKPKKHSHEAAWLDMSLPALSGPHCSRPWVQALRILAHGDKSL